MDNKGNLWGAFVLLILLVGGLSLLGGILYLINPESFYESVGNVIKDTSHPITCETRATQLIPKNLTLEERYNNSDEWEIPMLNNNTWNDGNVIKYFDNYYGIIESRVSSICFKRGANKGENIDFYYIKPCFSNSADSYLAYLKPVADSEGFVLGEREFSIEVALYPIKESRRESLQDFEIIDYRFLSCNWVESDIDKGEPTQ